MMPLSLKIHLKTHVFIVRKVSSDIQNKKYTKATNYVTNLTSKTKLTDYTNITLSYITPHVLIKLLGKLHWRDSSEDNTSSRGA